MTNSCTGDPGDVHITSLIALSPVIATWCVPASDPLHILFPLPDCERKKKPGLPTQVQDAPFPKVMLRERWRAEGDIW
jgi:hypothetical protein